MKKLNNKGIAFLVVVSFISLVLILVVQLKEQTYTNHQIAVNARDRLQAHYMALSGFNLSQMLLVYEKKIVNEFRKHKISMQGYESLYKVIPLSTELMKGLIPAALEFTEESEEPKEELQNSETAEGTEDSAVDTVQQSIGIMEKKKVEEFLDFDGEFSVEISEEVSKYSLNAISSIKSDSEAYDHYKKILYTLLMRKEFEEVFENQEQDALTLTHAIADFIDPNDTINEFGQVERGNENSLYENPDIKVKNAKMLTLSELRLIPGMNDQLFSLLAPQVSVYNASDKINACRAEESLVDALLLLYMNESQCTSPLNPDDDDRIKELRQIVLANCPDIEAMAMALNVELGLIEKAESESEAQTGTAEQKTTSSKIPGCKIQFKDLLSDENDVFLIKSQGYKGEVRTTLTVVLDTKSSNAKSWKILYYQEQ